MKIVISLLLLIHIFVSASIITDYKTRHFCLTEKYQAEIAVIRTFREDGEQKQLVVDTRTLQTSILPLLNTLGHPCKNTLYTRLLKQSITPPFTLQNDGIIETHKGITVSTDLCPSSKTEFEQELYEALIQHFPHPVPVTLFITGRWIQKHTESFEQFITWNKENKLSITWGNHTYTHPYHPKVPLEKNFALSQDYTLKKDTLELEKLLIEKGLVPSVFFRFPGLVSDTEAMHTIHDLGLITIGSDTWIAKDQKIRKSSIILLHGNKNEHKGVKMFLEMLDKGHIEEVKSLGESLQ